MKQMYQCPQCGAQVAFGTPSCPNCRIQLNWPTQQQPPPPQYQQPSQYQQPQQPGGGYQQQPEPPKKKSSKLGIISLGIILFAFAAVGSCVVCVMQPESSESPAPSGETITAIIQNELGTCNREAVEKIAGIDIVNAGYGYNIDIHFAIDDNLTESFIKGGAQMDVFDTVEALYTSEHDIQWVDMYGTFSMVDKYGNASEIEVLHARLGRDTARKINWDNMTREDLFDILDFLQWHPALQAIN